MKQFFIFLLFLSCTGQSIGQNLDSTTISLPCYLFVGGTETATTTPVDSATLYCWSVSAPISINGVLFNGQIGPVCTTTPEVQITAVLPSQMYIICVTATSSCCSSNTSCDTIFGTAQLSFPPSNNTEALPNTSAIYSVVQSCPGTTVSYVYTVTGDVTINGSGTTLNTPQDSVTLNFGGNFTSGTLCVYSINNFGLASPTICMPISIPVSLNEIGSDVSVIYFDAINHQLISTAGEKVLLEIYDSSGRRVKLIKAPEQVTDMSDLAPGIYVALLKHGGSNKAVKFSIVN